MQDDLVDWKREASQMGQFYENAYLTIAASSSRDDSSGLFPDMDMRLYELSYSSSDALSHGRPGLLDTIPDTHIKKNGTHPMFAFEPDNGTAFVAYKTEAGVAKLFLTPEWMPSSTKAHPITYRIGEFGRSFDPLIGEPLSERGWTLQERLLSPRTVHYGRCQMYWECQECLLAEDGAIFTLNCRTVPTLMATKLREITTHPHLLSTADHSNSWDEVDAEDNDSLASRTWSWTWEATWQRLIEGYSARLLTMEDDKLPAIAGLAKSIAERTGDSYFAGLWKSFLPNQLLWKVDVSEPIHMCNDQKHDKLLPPPWKAKVVIPSTYRAPSWSWAAIRPLSIKVKEVRLRVSSLKLISSSHYFRAMLEGSGLRKGEELKVYSFVKIKLFDLEDELTAMMIVLRILYEFDIQVPCELDLPTLDKVSVLVNKYQWHVLVTPYATS